MKPIMFLFFTAILAGSCQTVLAVAKILPPQDRGGSNAWYNTAYPPAKNLLPQPGVPNGVIFTFQMKHSKVFPGTIRTIQVYVPAEYKGRKPACVFVHLDTFGKWSFTTFNNLIYKKQMPITIGIGLPGGLTPSAHVSGKGRFGLHSALAAVRAGVSIPVNNNARVERSYEFDALNDNVGRFIIQEVIPAVERLRTPSGLPILLSKNPNDRCLFGGSSGGTCAFTVAFDNPDFFRRVIIYNGTFVGIRGADQYPTLVRKTAPEPLRIFLGDGCNDEYWPGAEMGNWWLNTRAMESALKFAGYQVHHVWGYTSHQGSMAVMTYPAALRWVWQGRHPKPIHAGVSGNPALQQMCRPGAHWRQLLHRVGGLGDLVSGNKGKIFVQSATSGKIYSFSHGIATLYAAVSPGSRGIAMGPGGQIYALDAGAGDILAVNAQGIVKVLATNIHGNGLYVMPNGNVYVTDTAAGTIWLTRPGGKPTEVAHGLNGPTGVIALPGNHWLCVAEGTSHFAMSFRIQPDGALRYGIPFYWLYQPETAANSGTGQLCADRSGYIFAATRMGVQVLSQGVGPCCAILPVPNGDSRHLTGICFGGRNRHTLYVTTAHSLYAIKMKSRGAATW
ncbi:MAG: hypothetical protein ACP5VQ_08880 [Phycisphaerae bacterium]